ncbi:deoxyguanosinetriphosphate triphosphohydrolase [Beijerinckia sp. L45]|uniref:deoxyguanosinetriphosphate triphosphohydrolase n=1 Tax=Beijerinckia sp. L45 TaxID=1641855 RepID=UPI00131BAC5D|nr:deoxyguanosinetriphosphate triphosphohydrolase [Beijerinckia sp. L45]
MHASSSHAPYAAVPEVSAGRLLSEPGSRTRSDFQRDRDRIIHSTAFRRLAHKTQVFVPHEGDHYRTRLTHSIEVGQLARALSRSLGLDEDLAEAVALAHDLGHTPFGHTGEDMLDAMMIEHGGFDHNAQTLRIVTKLERRYATFDGLNLTYETIEGLAKHNGPLRQKDGTPVPAYAARGIPKIFLEEDAVRSLGLDRYASAEAQSAALADDIAYNAHDLDDGLRAGLFSLTDCRDVPFLATLLDDVAQKHPGLDESRQIHELTRRLITRFVEDATEESRRRLHGLTSLDEVRDQSQAVVAFSASMAAAEKAIKAFLFSRMYRQRDMMRVREGAASVVRDLFQLFVARPETMAAEWSAASRAAAGPDAEHRRARLVCDYIAGMTDRYALAEHRRHFDATPELRYGARP